MSKFQNWLVLVIPIVFLIAAVATLYDYSYNWDEPFHFIRGQAYLHYFFTGREDYQDLPEYSRQQTNWPKRSYFQHPARDFSWVVEIDAAEPGHPPLNGILAALSNKIFYQYLGVLDDIEAHHLFSVVCGFLTVLLVAIWAYQEFGLVAGVVSALALATYPLFFGEVHFNVKDPPETFFFALTLYSFYRGITRRKARWIFLSAVAAGFALGTKFNIVFAAPIMGIWLFVYLSGRLASPSLEKTPSVPTSQKYSSLGSVLAARQNLVAQRFSWKVPRSAWLIIATLVLFLPIMLVTFFASWPFLWQDPLRNLSIVYQYYRQIGTGTRYQPDEFFIRGWNIYPMLWVLLTTPLVTLALSVMGILKGIVSAVRNDENKVMILFFLWLVVPIWRVSAPGFSVYGGSRQFMEFLPALAILAGLGFQSLSKAASGGLAHSLHEPKLPASPQTFEALSQLRLRTVRLISDLRSWAARSFARHSLRRLLVFLSPALLFVPITLKLISLHPNENVYFNPLIKGLKGAKEQNIPGWGANYGNVYLQGVKWLNEHAEADAHVGLPIGTLANLPRMKLREDIDFANQHWSGPLHQGEYEMELVDSTVPTDWYSIAYYEVFLEPVYEVKVEGVPLLKIWKNDIEHLKKGYEEEVELIPIKTHADTESAEADLGKDYYVTRLEIDYPTVGCDNSLAGGWVQIKPQEGDWQREVERIDYEQVPLNKNLPPGKFIWFFAAKKARLVTVKQPSSDRCILQNPTLRVFGLKNLQPNF